MEFLILSVYFERSFGRKCLFCHLKCLKFRPVFAAHNNWSDNIRLKSRVACHCGCVQGKKKRSISRQVWAEGSSPLPLCSVSGPLLACAFDNFSPFQTDFPVLSLCSQLGFMDLLWSYLKKNKTKTKNWADGTWHSLPFRSSLASCCKLRAPPRLKDHSRMHRIPLLGGFPLRSAIWQLLLVSFEASSLA